jgi:hypothetical protein
MSLQASYFVASQEFSGNFPGSSLWGNKTSPSQNKIIKKSLVSIGPFQYNKNPGTP